ncbi:hypothetical protein IE077_003792 [Cardiosporidium cionae]|uniref:RNA helicase n=1 Tax=Cardiosporidium cionae TaxID=476202 RepID=A0ABQ7J7G9_9APIC|nr:hypothetical protein IE077_003792 [Cardiosporidium cionae]|eukprot:KAF8819926.1 hypothetical protein IE077_003792 [Cardiosporidium cionae]
MLHSLCLIPRSLDYGKTSLLMRNCAQGAASRTRKSTYLIRYGRGLCDRRNFPKRYPELSSIFSWPFMDICRTESPLQSCSNKKPSFARDASIRSSTQPESSGNKFSVTLVKLSLAKCFHAYCNSVGSQRAFSTTSFPTEFSRVIDLPVDPLMKENLISGLGIRKLFEIQKRAFSDILVGNDVVIYSKTGTGKTVSYLLPLLQRSKNEKMNLSHSILILVPTRELCKQIGSVMLNLYPPTKVALVYGGADIDSQRTILKQGAHAIVATPGRALQFAEDGTLNIRNLKAIAIDEADSMLSRGLVDKVEKILAKATKMKIQTVLVTASMPAELQQLISVKFSSAIVLDVVNKDAKLTYHGNSTRFQEKTELCSSSVDHRVCKVSQHSNHRMQSLIHLLSVKFSASEKRCIVFANSQKEVEDIVNHPLISPQAHALHAQMDQSQRDAAIAAFSSQPGSILICTDLVSRGLDFPDVAMILHVHPPENPWDYLHRAGRTGRAYKAGLSIMLYDKLEYKFVQKISDQTHQHFNVEALPDTKKLEHVLLSRLLKCYSGNHFKSMTLGNVSGADDLFNVPPEEYEPLIPRAERLLNSGGKTSPMATAMAILEGRYIKFTDTSARLRSQLTGKKGYAAVLLHDPSHQVIDSRNKVVAYLQKVLPGLHDSVQHLVVPIMWCGYCRALHFKFLLEIFHPCCILDL